MTIALSAPSTGALRLRPYTPQDAPIWDHMVERSLTGTFLHTRDFMGYHGDRFIDRSLMIEGEAGQLLGIFPAASLPSDPHHVISHPGLTYAGLLHAGGLRGLAMLEAFEAIRAAYRQAGAVRLTYKAAPAYYHRVLMQDDLYALFRLGAERYRSDLCAVIDLRMPFQPDLSRERNSRRALRRGLAVRVEPCIPVAFWRLLEATLQERHDARPVHTFEEISRLEQRFPAQIRCVSTYLGDELAAGTILFLTPHVDRAQYMAAGALGRAEKALDLLIDACVRESLARGQHHFDFGSSNEQDGQLLNDSLYTFKNRSGGGSCVQEFFTLPL